MILVVGDIIVDEFIWGDVSRISPEAPVPIVDVERIDRRLGGSANVVRNLHVLEMPAAMFGVVGDDEPGRWARRELASLGADLGGILVKGNKRPTAIKTRIIARHQQVVRFDREWREPLQPQTKQALIRQIHTHLSDAKAIIFSDYGKGVIDHSLLKELLPLVRNKINAIDPKPEHVEAYKGAFLITPNIFEAAAMAEMEPINEDEPVAAIAKRIRNRLQVEYVLVTRSEKGMSLYDGTRIHHIPTAARDVFDVTGAGDTVIAVMTAALVRGMTILDAAHLANRAAGVVVGKLGTATASWGEIERQTCA